MDETEKSVAERAVTKGLRGFMEQLGHASLFLEDLGDKELQLEKYSQDENTFQVGYNVCLSDEEMAKLGEDSTEPVEWVELFEVTVAYKGKRPR